MRDGKFLHVKLAVAVHAIDHGKCEVAASFDAGSLCIHSKGFRGFIGRSGILAGRIQESKTACQKQASEKGTLFYDGVFTCG
jgi:hypothetical protein